MKFTRIIYRNTLPVLAAAALLYSCSAQKESTSSVSMQNLTAHFNILYNATEQYNETQAEFLESTPEDYSQVLTVYKEPQRAASGQAPKALDSVLLRANAVIAEKSRSNYVDDAWLLIGKVNYLKAEFFNAAEFFNYIYTTYYDDKALRQEALFWKARSLMRLNDMEHAAVALDSALKHPVGTDRAIADVYAAEAQFNIRSGNEEHAIEMLKKALKTGSSRQNLIRWNYVLAQLEERNGHPDEAIVFYTTVVKSNAPFEMVFNANLNRMKLRPPDGSKGDRITSLLSLTKQYKNRDFLDQVYFKIAEIYMEQGDEKKAVANYRLGLAKSTVNRNQKGLLYLKLADLNFKEQDYVRAKAYYDSTLQAMSPDFPGYAGIQLKSSSLDFLAARFNEISRQDTLQMLARLPENELLPRVGALVREQVKRSGSISQQPGPFLAAIDVQDKNGITEGKFYFNNTIALSQGLNDFKKRWGNRKLEDNWRRSNKGGADIPAQGNGNAATGNNAQAMVTPQPEDRLVQDLMSEVPLTAVQMNGSNEKIISAYYDLAGFYYDRLKDDAEAIKTYQLLLSRFPQNMYKPSVYYNLYRLYSGTDEVKAATYRNLLIKEFPESLYAKVVLDPDYSKKADQQALDLNAAYTGAYTAYTHKDYSGVIRLAGLAQVKFGQNTLSPQLAYLSALATGHLQKIDTLEQAFNRLVNAYPSDLVVTPLVTRQLQFINDNRQLLEQRSVALLDADPDAPVLERPVQQPAVTLAVVAPSVLPVPAGKTTGRPMVTHPVNPPVQKGIVNDKPAEKGPVIPVPAPAPVKPAPLYDLPETGDYYFVINVNDARLNLNPSRFGLGQFNHSNYAAAGIQHQTKDLAENELVLVGRFPSLAAVRAYESKILPVMKEIMKIPAEKYNTFVITGKELDKLNTREGVDQYAEFYRHQ